MTALVESLCERMARGLDSDPHLLASRLGRADAVTNAALVSVQPNDSRFSSAVTSINRETGTTSLVTLIPAQPLFLPDIANAFGAYREVPRLHPDDPRKFIFSRSPDASHPYVVDVVAYVTVRGETSVDTASVEKLLISRSVGPTGKQEVPPAAAVTPWSRLLGEPVRFSVRSLRVTPIDNVRSEIERVFGPSVITQNRPLLSDNYISPSTTIRSRQI